MRDAYIFCLTVYWFITPCAMAQEIKLLFGFTSASLQYSPDGKHIVQTSGVKATIIEIATGKKVTDLIGHDKPLISAAFNADGKYVVTGSWDGTAKVWETTTGKLVSNLKGHKKEISSVSFFPNLNHNARLAINKPQVDFRTFPGIGRIK